MSPIISNTPVELWSIPGRPARVIAVKREDLCSPLPGPSFSKIRGVMAHIATRPEPVIGVLDTYHSKAGWAVAYCCRVLGKRCVNFWPRYKKDDGPGWYLPRKPQQMARELGAQPVALTAGRSAVLYHAAKKSLRDAYGDEAYLMPNALKLPESVTETAAEVWRTLDTTALLTAGAQACWVKNVVISVSSGTIAAGVLRGFATHPRFRVDGGEPLPTFVLHAGYSRSRKAVFDYLAKAGGPAITRALDRAACVDEGYQYKDAYKPTTDEQRAPFPCNPYYDAKAWGWMMTKGQMLNDVLFWNVGE